nr:3140_t:CDS:2 [Entrophospora candida]
MLKDMLEPFDYPNEISSSLLFFLKRVTARRDRIVPVDSYVSGCPQQQ